MTDRVLPIIKELSKIIKQTYDKYTKDQLTNPSKPSDLFTYLSSHLQFTSPNFTTLATHLLSSKPLLAQRTHSTQTLLHLSLPLYPKLYPLYLADRHPSPVFPPAFDVHSIFELTGAEALCKIINGLVLGKSTLVVGKDCWVVTSAVFTLAELIKPL